MSFHGLTSHAMTNTTMADNVWDCKRENSRYPVCHLWCQKSCAKKSYFKGGNFTVPLTHHMRTFGVNPPWHADCSRFSHYKASDKGSCYQIRCLYKFTSCILWSFNFYFTCPRDLVAVHWIRWAWKVQVENRRKKSFRYLDHQFKIWVTKSLSSMHPLIYSLWRWIELYVAKVYAWHG